MKVTLELQEPHAAQRVVEADPSRYKVLACGRRFGKTDYGQGWLLEPALEGGYPVGWFAPAHKYMTEVWRSLETLLAPVTLKKDSQEHRLELVTGGVIECWSVHNNPDAGRSRKYKRVFIDEAAMIPNLKELWNGAIRATLLDYAGEAMFASSPKGRNYFYELFLRGGQRKDWASFQFPSESNPYMPRSEIEAIRLEVESGEMPESYYQQEYMAAFIEMDGQVFKGINRAATSTWETKPVPGRTYVAGGDWGMTNDRTVISVMDVEDQRQVDQIRFTNIDFDDQINRVVALNERWGLKALLAEDNSIGKAFIQALRARGVPMQSWHASNSTKHEMIQKLALDIEMGHLRILNEPVQIGELMAYEATRMPSGLIKYGAPEGMHDDCVISLGVMNLAGSKRSKARQEITVIKRH